MQTPWGQIAVADAHVHFFSRSFLRQLALQKGTQESPADLCAILGWEAPPETAEQCAAQWAAELVRNEVSQATLIASLPGEEDSVLAAVASFPGRFFGWFFLNPLAPDALDRCKQGFTSISSSIKACGREKSICISSACTSSKPNSQSILGKLAKQS